MITFLEDFLTRFSEQVIGTSGATGLYIAMIIVVVGLLILLSVARFPLELSLIIASPMIFVLSIGGWLPPITLSAGILLVALFWGGLILAVAGNK